MSEKDQRVRELLLEAHRIVDELHDKLEAIFGIPVEKLKKQQEDEEVK